MKKEPTYNIYPAAPYDRRAKLFTYLISGVFIALMMLHPITAGTWNFLYYLYLPAFFIIRGFQPQWYTITEDAIIIKRPFGYKYLPFFQIGVAEPVSKKELGFNFLPSGTAGLLGYIGQGYSRDEGTGKYEMCYTSQREMILIIWYDTIVISPQNRKAFLKELYSKHAGIQFKGWEKELDEIFKNYPGD